MTRARRPRLRWQTSWLPEVRPRLSRLGSWFPRRMNGPSSILVRPTAKPVWAAIRIRPPVDTRTNCKLADVARGSICRTDDKRWKERHLSDALGEGESRGSRTCISGWSFVRSVPVLPWARTTPSAVECVPPGRRSGAPRLVRMAVGGVDSLTADCRGSVSGRCGNEGGAPGGRGARLTIALRARRRPTRARRCAPGAVPLRRAPRQRCTGA